MADSRTRFRVVRIVVDFICVFLAWLPVIVYSVSSIQPYRRGFFCDDDSIKYPYKKDTISTSALIGIGIAGSVGVIIITELVNFLVARKGECALPSFELGRHRVNLFLWNCYKYIGIFNFGAGVCLSFTFIGKYSVGRLRPHFMDVCKLDLTNVNCSSYVEEYVCQGTGATDYQLTDMRLSFPSGHASFSVFFAFYAMLYLQSRLQWKGSVLLKHLIQAALMALGFYISLSRIFDYKHHWGDVLAGALVGAATAIGVVFTISDLYRRPIEMTLSQQMLRQAKKVSPLVESDGTVTNIFANMKDRVNDPNNVAV